MNQSELVENPKLNSHEQARAEFATVEDSAESEINWLEVLRIGLVALCAIAVWFRVWEPFPRISLIGLAGVLIGGWPIFKEAFENLAERRMTMELSMTIAILAAAAISEFFTALVITVRAGRRSARRHDRFARPPRDSGSAGVLAARRGRSRRRRSREVSVGEVRSAIAVLVDPGGLIPVDGVVIAGHSFVDQSRITGESMPVEKLPDSIVYAGTINQSGALEVRAERIGRDTSYGKIIEAVEQR